MDNSKRLYMLYKEKPRISNQDVMEALDWSSIYVRKYKYLLKQKELIDVDAAEGVIILKDYPDTAIHEASEFKQEAYKHLYDICASRAENTDISTPQLISLVQEIRLILNQII